VTDRTRRTYTTYATDAAAFADTPFHLGGIDGKIRRVWLKDWRGRWAKEKPRGVVALGKALNGDGEVEGVTIVGKPNLRRVYQRWFDAIQQQRDPRARRQWRRRVGGPRVVAECDRRQRRAAARTERRRRRRARRTA
jgi:hypothetical protein